MRLPRTFRVPRAWLLGALLAVNAGAGGAEQDVSRSTQHKLPPPAISAAYPFQGNYVHVLDSRMHYVEAGSGEPIVFIHGNPTSSYLWRNVIPYGAEQGRAIALDLIGMGKSDKPCIAYTFDDHYRYLEAFIDALGLRDITLVLHDWGATLGFEYARRHPQNVKAIAFMEGVLPPAFPQPSFEAMGEEMGSMFRAFKHPGTGAELVIQNNFFIERVLPGLVNRPLTAEEMDVYRAPWVDKGARWPMLVWPREIPIAGEPASTMKTLRQIATYMEEADKPMLLLYAAPGVLVPPAAVQWYTARIKRLETVYVGQGLHFIQEDQPETIGRALSEWVRRLDSRVGAAPSPAGHRKGQPRTQEPDRGARAPMRCVPA
jgi:haloalkane dehalogenase